MFSPDSRRVSTFKRFAQAAGFIVASVFAATGMTGCAGSFASGGSSPAASLAPVAGGLVMGGEQPIANAQIVLYTPGTSGYGSASQTLMTAVVTTTSKGNFTLTGAFACPSASAPVYLVVLGGNPGLAAGTSNAGIVLLSVLGTCGSITDSSFFSVNELTTVAAVYSLAPFMTDYAHIGSSAANGAGMATAFTTAANLVSTAGKAPGAAPAIATVPAAEINSLGNVIASCTNTNGDTSAGKACATLYAAATPANGTAPADVSQALLNIARNPGNNVSAVFKTGSAQAPFQPVLSAQPADWTMGIEYTAPAFHGVSDLAIDSQGQVWIAASPGTLSNGSSTISTLTVNGLAGSYPQLYTSYANMAVDAYDRVWLTNTTASNVVVLTNSGARVNSVAYTGGGMSGPGALAFDPAGNVWVANSSAMISELSASGQPVSATGFATGGSSGPVAVASDAQGGIWTASFSGNQVARLTGGKPVAGSPFTGSGLSGPFALALDSAGQAYAANRNTSTVTRLNVAGGSEQSAALTGAGLSQPLAVAVDGASTLWLANGAANTVSVFASAATSPAAMSLPGGFGAASLLNPLKLAVDGAGNVWVANVGTNTTGSGVITQLVGAAAPVVTPLAVAVAQGHVATRP